MLHSFLHIFSSSPSGGEKGELEMITRRKSLKNLNLTHLF